MFRQSFVMHISTRTYKHTYHWSIYIQNVDRNCSTMVNLTQGYSLMCIIFVPKLEMNECIVWSFITYVCLTHTHHCQSQSKTVTRSSCMYRSQLKKNKSTNSRLLVYTFMFWHDCNLNDNDHIFGLHPWNGKQSVSNK